MPGGQRPCGFPARVQQGEVDLLTSVADSPERERFLSFGHEPSFTVWSLLYTHPQIQIQSILDVAGHRVGVMRGDMNGMNFRKLCESFRITRSFEELASFGDVLAAVAAGRVDAGVTPSTFGYANGHEFKVRRSSVVVAPFDLFMNNVLGAILGLASANLKAQPEGTPVREAFETILRAAERGGKTVKSLLGFARQSPAESRELDMNQILQEEVRLLERTTLARVRLVTELEPALRPIVGDAGALTHAFMNLCVNAVDAMAGNGVLTLRTRNGDGGWIEVLVEDTGTGMAPEVLAKAWTPSSPPRRWAKAPAWACRPCTAWKPTW